MAVYTQLGAEALAALIGHYDVGTLVSAKGIAEGVSNSNWLIETSGASGGGPSRFILTLYEARTELADLPFFLGLLDHLAARACPVPRTIHDRTGASFQLIDTAAVGASGAASSPPKGAALIEFMPGLSVAAPTRAQARAVGAALAGLHLASRDFSLQRANTLAPAAWRDLAHACGEAGLAAIDPGLPELVTRELAAVARAWPADLPRGTIHADLFPDNVLMLGDSVTGLIDFYFACIDLIAYDIAVTHAAWCFDAGGRGFNRALSAALLGGYHAVRPIDPAERAALPILARGATLRFLLTRAYDSMNTPPGALVMRKDPLAFARRLAFYADPANAAVFAA